MNNRMCLIVELFLCVLSIFLCSSGIESKKGSIHILLCICMLPLCVGNWYKSWHRYVFTISGPIAILISKAFHRPVRMEWCVSTLTKTPRKKSNN